RELQPGHRRGPSLALRTHPHPGGVRAGGASCYGTRAPPPRPRLKRFRPMITVDFPGSRKLIEAIDASVAQPSTPAITDSLRNALCDLIRSQEVELPSCVFET